MLRSGAGAHFRCNLIDGVDWHMVKNYLPDNCQVFLAENKSKHSDFTEGTKFRRTAQEELLVDVGSDESDDVDTESSENEQQETPKKKGKIKKIRLMSTYGADFTSGQSAVVIGGETHGISKEAYRLSTELDGCTVYLPMMPGIESINAAMALTAILFEAKRQFLSEDFHVDGESDSGRGKDEAMANYLN